MKEDLYTNIVDNLDDKELMQCLQAAKLADTQPAQDISLPKAQEFVSMNVSPKVVKRSFSLVYVLSAVAAIALGVFLFLRNPEQASTAPVADQNPEVENADEPVVDEILGEESVVSMEQETANDKTDKKTASVAEKPEKPETESSPVMQDDVSRAAMAEMSTFELISPSKDIYRIRVVDETKAFPFQWDATGIDGARLILQDRDGNIILQEDFTTEDHFDLLASVVLPYRDVVWSMFVQYQDGREARKSGLISFIKAE